jgi:hypothetical protein
MACSPSRRCVTLAVAPMVILALSIALAAQGKPDFSGSWTRTETKYTAGGPGSGTGAVAPADLTLIHQTPGSISIEQDGPFGTTVYTFKLDGTESTNRNGAMTMTSRSHWMAGLLITQGSEEQTTSQGHSAWQFKEARSLDAHGALVVDTTRTRPDGSTSTLHEVFVKKSK